MLNMGTSKQRILSAVLLNAFEQPIVKA